MSDQQGTDNECNDETLKGDKEQIVGKPKNGDFRASLWENPNFEAWGWELEVFNADYNQPWQRAAHGMVHTEEDARRAIERAKRVVVQAPIEV